MKHKNTQPLYVFNRENPQNSETQNGLRRGLDFIALLWVTLERTATVATVAVLALEKKKDSGGLN